MKRYSTATLMGMTKKQLVEHVRMAEHNRAAAEEFLEQQARNFKDYEPVSKELRKTIRMLHDVYEKAKRDPHIRNPLAYALYRVWKAADQASAKEE